MKNVKQKNPGDRKKLKPSKRLKENVKQKTKQNEVLRKN
jgi:hypothetical protein